MNVLHSFRAFPIVGAAVAASLLARVSTYDQGFAIALIAAIAAGLVSAWSP